MFHKEGYRLIGLSFILALVLLGIGYLLLGESTFKWIFFALAAFVLVAVLQFFRNPKRKIITSDQYALSPVDGKVVAIETVYEPEYFKEKRLQISVFMSPVNVHVTRYPVGGEVVFSKYHPGKYLVAWHPKSSEENERTTVVVKNKVWGDVLHRQIAGALARRIVNYATEKSLVSQGSDSGFIKFGSRVDVFLPLDSIVQVSINQKVQGGITQLATR